ncbi:DUF2271 domain-containing protein [Gemmatimonas sp.]|uniref:DUF2271 domain-containing protein n=1 Tax=Gemmatimonas sp. TaxID=1962908 RepID=UPI0039195B41
MRYVLPVAISTLLGTPGALVPAADLNVKLELPRLNVAEYHKPYIAVWIEKRDQSFVGNLTVWQDLKKRNNEGTRWLKDLRQWWRKSGRELNMPVDGLSAATRTAGEHSLTFSTGNSVLGQLPAGEYQLMVEVVREAGGREAVRVPFTWGGKGEFTAKAQGSREIGTVAVQIK